MEVAPRLYPNLTEVYRIEWRSVEADRGPRHFKISIYERLTNREPARFFPNYEERVELEIDGERRSLWVDVNLPAEACDSVEECMHGALSRLNED
jgi:hypothetical protein